MISKELSMPGVSLYSLGIVMLTSEQVRAARAMLRWEQKALAEMSGVSLPTIKRLEAQTGELAANKPTISALARALEAAGVEFIPENGGGAGVRLRKIETAAGLANQIEVLEAKSASIPEPGEPSPETGMNLMKRAVVENDLVALRGRRKRLKKST